MRKLDRFTPASGPRMQKRHDPDKRQTQAQTQEAGTKPTIPFRPRPSRGKTEFLPHAQLSRKYPGHLAGSKLLPVKGVALGKKNIVFADMTEVEVIARAQAGDVECFEALYARHRQRVFSQCLRMTGNQAQADDFTQEAFLQLFRKISSFRGESAFSTWLHRLSVNIVLMSFRKKGLVEVSLEQILDPQQEDGPTKNIGMRDKILHGTIDRITLEQALEDLPPGYRMIFVLHDIEGYEHNEIGQMLGCTVGNSKSQLHKARLRLRDFLLRGAKELLTSPPPKRVAENLVLAVTA
jgi:RNA polymerase sigma-70 factor (ECF subfamily)